jgi:phosphohistidine phosphatase
MADHVPATRRLTLLRHAKSSWSDDTIPDLDRPLSTRGERDAPEMASRLLARAEHPDLIVTSHARRALQTARIFARALGVPDSRLLVERALYLATPGEIMALIARQRDAVSDLMVVGHNPGMTALANALLPDLGLANLPTAGVVVMELSAAGWADAVSSGGRLVRYDYPKKSS